MEIEMKFMTKIMQSRFFFFRRFLSALTSSHSVVFTVEWRMKYLTNLMTQTFSDSILI